MITVKLLAVLKEYAPIGSSDGCVELDHSPGMTVAEALGATDISKATHRFSTLVNGKKKDANDVLEDGDTVTVMPLLAGG